jgi:fructose-bisphosphate aldolase, class II
MPVADYAKYCEMLDRARKEKFAYPAINVTSSTTANAVLKALALILPEGSGWSISLPPTWRSAWIT